MEFPVNIQLDEDFVRAYDNLISEYGSEMAKLNGFAPSALSYTDFIDNFIGTKTVADASVDGSANVGRKDIVTLITEMPKPHEKLLAFNKIFCTIKKLFGLKAAKNWLENEWNGSLYLHDSNTSTFVSYCFAYDLKDLAEKGLYFLEGDNTPFNAMPAKHLVTFVDFVKEFINYASNRTSGACGLPNLIPYLYYFWDRDVKSGYFTETPEKYAVQNLQRLIYALNQPYTRNGVQSAFTNTSIFDHAYMEALFGGSTFPDGSPMYFELDGIMEFQKLFMRTLSDIRHENAMTFPVNSISILRHKDGTFADEEFARWAIEHNMKWSDSNIFVDDSVTSLSNCCRLKSNIKDLGYFNSIGGTALKVGSVKVSTVNLARIAYETLDESVDIEDKAEIEKRYISRLKKTLKTDLIALHAVRHIIERNVEKGLLKNFEKGLIDFEHLYNTIGFIGIYETMSVLGYTECDILGNTKYTDDAFRFGKVIFETIHKARKEWMKREDVNYSVNCEQIPGETAANKLMRKDILLYSDLAVMDLPVYGNQFLPLGIQATLEERVKTAAIFDGYCNGGSILHVNVDAPFDSFDKAWTMFNYICDQGVTYFAFNTKIQACSDNHAFYGDICPKCGKPVSTEYTRIVGFLTPVKSYSKERKEEFKLRKWERVNEGS